MLWRYEKTAALGSQRLNASGMVSLADCFFFFLRQPATEFLVPELPMSRVQKRLIHLISQHVEVALANGKGETSLEAPTLAVHSLGVKQTWSSARSRNQTADLLRQELIKRFMCKPTGFVSGTQNSDNKDVVHASKDNSNGLQAASQLTTAYFAKASDMLLHKLSQQRFKHLAYYHDAAKVFTYDVPLLNQE